MICSNCEFAVFTDQRKIFLFAVILQNLPSFLGDGAKCYTSLATDHKWNENGASVTCRLHESLDLNIWLRLDFGLFVNLDVGLNFSIKSIL